MSDQKNPQSISNPLHRLVMLLFFVIFVPIFSIWAALIQWIVTASNTPEMPPRYWSATKAGGKEFYDYPVRVWRRMFHRA